MKRYIAFDRLLADDTMSAALSLQASVEAMRETRLRVDLPWDLDVPYSEENRTAFHQVCKDLDHSYRELFEPACQLEAEAVTCNFLGRIKSYILLWPYEGGGREQRWGPPMTAEDTCLDPHTRAGFVRAVRCALPLQTPVMQRLAEPLLRAVESSDYGRFDADLSAMHDNITPRLAEAERSFAAATGRRVAEYVDTLDQSLVMDPSRPMVKVQAPVRRPS